MGSDLSVRIRRAKAKMASVDGDPWRRSVLSALRSRWVGSGASGGLLTTAERKGDTWTLNGEKKWIGNSTWGDVAIIWARDVDDGQVKGFNRREPYARGSRSRNSAQDGAASRPERPHHPCRLQSKRGRPPGQREFICRHGSRAAHDAGGVAWQSVGCATGAYEHALRYAQTREQFGRPIAKFQLVQDLLFRMLGNITSSQSYACGSHSYKTRV